MRIEHCLHAAVPRKVRQPCLAPPTASRTCLPRRLDNFAYLAKKYFEEELALMGYGYNMPLSWLKQAPPFPVGGAQRSGLPVRGPAARLAPPPALTVRPTRRMCGP